VTSFTIDVNFVRDAFEESKHPRDKGKFTTGSKATTPAEHQQAVEHHQAQHDYHKTEAEKRGENLGKPAAGSHANASGLHHSAVFYHQKALEDPAEYGKKARWQSTLANGASNAIASGKKPYPTEKSNNWQPPTHTSQELAAKRISRYLGQKFIHR